MRLLIQSNNRWSIELTSAKHHTVDCSTEHREPAFASPISLANPITRSSDNKSPTSSVAIPTAGQQKLETDRYPTLRRHKSIRERLSRLCVHFTRLQTPSQASSQVPVPQETFEYHYSGDTSELPAGEMLVAGSATFEEMPASFPEFPVPNGEPFELEQPQPHTVRDRFYAMNESYEEILLNSCMNHAKQPFIDPCAMHREPIPVATPKSLPRLLVPGSMNNIPAMTYDQSPSSASSISPNTPVGHINNGIQPHWTSRSAPPLVSPCDTTSTLPWYNPQPQHYQALRDFDSPLTSRSTGSSNSATPLSTYPQSTDASFGAWPQPGPEYLRTAFPQRYQPINHESNMHLTPNFHPNTWVSETKPHQCCYHGSQIDDQNHAMPPASITHTASQHAPPAGGVQSRNEKSAYNESQLLPAIYIQDTANHVFSSAEEVAPPVYSPLSASPPHYAPATCKHCGKVFTGKYGKGNLMRHTRQVHESFLGGAIHLCRVCMKTYNRADALRKHSWKKHRDEDSRPNKRRRA